MDKIEKNWSETLNKIDEPENDRFSFLEFLWDIIKTAAIVVIIAFGIKYFLVQPFIVDGNSMQPNFENNEYLLVEKLSLKFSAPRRGDVIVFHPPGQASVNYIKRIIGLPNEEVVITDNKIKIINQDHPNGIYLSEPYIPNSSITSSDIASSDFKLGADEYFVMGDNREHSSDSREWGNLPKSNIIGRAWINVYPLNEFGLIQRLNFSI